jgi:hypothetical protein
MTRENLLIGWKLLLVAVLIAVVLTMTGCESTQTILSGLDYACIDIQGDGYFTDSGLQGRGIVVPEGETLTPETVEALCN